MAIVASLIGLFAIFVTYSLLLEALRQESTATEVTGGLRDNNRYARGFHTLLVEKYYLDHFYEGVVAESTKGWMARCCLLGQPERASTTSSTTPGRERSSAGRFVYRFIDQGAIDGTVNGSGLTALSSGGILRHVQSGKIRQYATLMFGAAAVLAAVFIVAV